MSSLCLECLSDGNHTGHSLCNFLKRPDLVDKGKQIERFNDNLERSTMALQSGVDNFSDSFAKSKVILSDYVSKMKEKLCKEIDENAERLLKKCTDKETMINNELEKMKKTTSDIGEQSLKTLELDDLKEAFEKGMENTKIIENKAVTQKKGFFYTEKKIRRELKMKPLLFPEWLMYRKIIAPLQKFL